MTTNDDMIARLPKERQDKIRKNVAKEVAKYRKENELLEQKENTDTK